MNVQKGFKSITVLTLLVLVAVSIILVGCVPKLVLNPITPNLVLNVPSSTQTNTLPAPTGNADLHYIQPTDYFYMAEPFENSDWERVNLGKLITPPTPETKNQGQFMNAYSGVNEWAKWWAITRIATREELKLGLEVIFFDTYGENSVLRAPESTQDARTSDWGISRITDMSELFKGYVMIGGGYKVSEKNLRVIVK